MENPHPSSEQATRPHLDTGSIALLGAAGGEVATQLTRQLTIAGQEFQTDLPIGVDPLTADASPYSDPIESLLDPKCLDSMPIGDFTIIGQPHIREADPWDGTPEEVVTPERRLRVVGSDFGKVVTPESYGSVHWLITSDAARLMTAIGFTVESDGREPVITGIPTPETFRRAMASQGVEVRLFSDHGQIPAKDYLQAFADGTYPVSTGDPSYYKHDIEDDHATAMILGGEELKSAMAISATEVLSLPEGPDKQDKISDRTLMFDNLTATLRAVVSAHPELLGEAYGESRGWATFVATAKEAGIPSDSAAAILEAAQARGRVLGLNVTPLQRAA